MPASAFFLCARFIRALAACVTTRLPVSIIPGPRLSLSTLQIGAKGGFLARIASSR
jgi:hypothetical protein